MVCPCCLPRCCPAFRAFDGTNKFYRYFTYYDWDIPTFGVHQYVLTPQDQDFAIMDPSGTPAPPGRLVDGHVVADALSLCPGYPEASLPSVTGGPRYPPGSYGNRSPANSPSRGLLGGEPSPYIPSRQPTIFNRGSGLSNIPGGGRELSESYIPASGDPDWFAYLLGSPQVPTKQKDGFSLIRSELSGEYSSPPSPYCHINSLDNPLP